MFLYNNLDSTKPNSKSQTVNKKLYIQDVIFFLLQ